MISADGDHHQQMAYSATEILRLRRSMTVSEAHARAAYEAMMNAYSQFLTGSAPGPSAEDIARAQSLALAAEANRRKYLARLEDLSAASIGRQRWKASDLKLGQDNR